MKFYLQGRITRKVINHIFKLRIREVSDFPRPSATFLVPFDIMYYIHGATTRPRRSKPFAKVISSRRGPEKSHKAESRRASKSNYVAVEKRRGD